MVLDEIDTCITPEQDDDLINVLRTGYTFLVFSTPGW